MLLKWQELHMHLRNSRCREPRWVKHSIVAIPAGMYAAVRYICVPVRRISVGEVVYMRVTG